MKLKQWLVKAGAAAFFLQMSLACALPPLDLRGYTNENGAISILHGGDTTDPYFALQALLLAHDNGMDISKPAAKFADWLVTHQKPDGTFDRFCKGASNVWASCKTADADDSLLALWMRLLQTMPQELNANPLWLKSHSASKKSLDHLFQPSRGIYMVSPVYLHGLLMDNLEVWSYKARLPLAQRTEAKSLATAISATFWQGANRQFLVSTQLEQKTEAPRFYPDRVAQIFPMLVDFPLLPQAPHLYYHNWMRMHRGEWLRQGESDYPWGLLAVLALRQGDVRSAGCWLRETAAMRHGSRWAVTDEAALQILKSRSVPVASVAAQCQ